MRKREFLQIDSFFHKSLDTMCMRWQVECFHKLQFASHFCLSQIANFKFATFTIVLQDPSRVQGLLVFLASVVLAQCRSKLKILTMEKSRIRIESLGETLGERSLVTLKAQTEIDTKKIGVWFDHLSNTNDISFNSIFRTSILFGRSLPIVLA